MAGELRLTVVALLLLPGPVAATLAPDMAAVSSDPGTGAVPMGPLPLLNPGLPMPGSGTTCAGAPAAEAGQTRGSGDAAIPTLVWAALKTGFRAVVAWHTDTPVRGRVTFDLAGPDSRMWTEPTERTEHVFVFDGLPVQHLMCFQASSLYASGTVSSAPHALRLANAMKAYDAATGTYSINLLVLSNEKFLAAAELEEGLDRYARKLWDATDGRIRSGAVIALHADFEHHNTGWTSCYVAFIVTTTDAPTCNRVHDVIFTYDEYAAGAASTYLDGLQNPDVSIWMSNVWQANELVSVDDVGTVLLHEMGHYAFAALDLYNGPDCYNTATGISIMGSSRAATEFDDEVARCPPGAAGSVPYVPSWTLMRQRFTQIPDRTTGPVAGPAGNGGAHALHPFRFLGPAPVIPQNDAGSGRDAPDTPTPAVWIAPGVVYTGTMTVARDAADHYAFAATAGTGLEARVFGRALCPTFHDGTSAAYASCTIAADGSVRITWAAAATGTYYLVVDRFSPGPYWFSLSLGGTPPSPRPA